MDEKLSSLKNNIWITRKARINASERLLRLERFIQFINIYYSCFICILSVYGLTITNNKIGVISTILSIILTISIVYLNSQNFGQRSQQLKVNYISLQKLIFKLDRLDENTTNNLTEYRNEYSDLLASCENHSVCDYYRIRLSTEELNWKSTIRITYYACKIFKYFWEFVAVLIPILLTIYIFI